MCFYIYIKIYYVDFFSNILYTLEDDDAVAYHNFPSLTRTISFKYLADAKKKKEKLYNSNLFLWQKDAGTTGTEQSRCLLRSWLYYTYRICPLDLTSVSD